MAEATNVQAAPETAAAPETNDADKKPSSDSFLGRMLGGMSDLSGVRQIGLMAGLAASIALGVGIILWSQEPEYRALGPRDPRMVNELIDMLQKDGYKYKLDAQGQLLVRAADYQAIQLTLAGTGVDPWQETAEADYLDRDSGFGVSQRLEKARLLRTREVELAQTIRQMNAVKNAKVHLALPKESVFARFNKEPSASVMLNLYTGRRLSQEEIETIVNLVASSVPGMSTDKITVVDHKGRLLNAGSLNPVAKRNRMEMEIEKQREEDLTVRLSALMDQVVGMHDYHVEVNVDMDFSATEQTRKTYNPDLPAIRSEMQIEDNRMGSQLAGVPGALSNQPPQDAQAPEVAVNQGGTQRGQEGASRKEVTRNYELDTAVSHTRQQVGKVRRITVSAGVDYLDAPMKEGASDGEMTKVPRSQEELENIRRLLVSAAGLDFQRGDVLEVVNFPFAEPKLPDDFGEPAFWQHPWVEAILNKGPGWLLALVVIFGVLRPVMRKLATIPNVDEDLALPDMTIPGEDEISEVDMPDVEETLKKVKNPYLPGPLGADQDLLTAVRSVVGNDPGLVAQVIKEWIEQD